jgi:hypothetical protein
MRFDLSVHWRLTRCLARRDSYDLTSNKSL